MATSRVASPLARTVRWPCVSPAGSRALRRSVLVSEVREHTRVLQSPESLYHFPPATSYTPPRTTLVLARDIVFRPTTPTAGSPTYACVGRYATVPACAGYTWAHPPTCAPYTAVWFLTSARAGRYTTSMARKSFGLHFFKASRNRVCSCGV